MSDTTPVPVVALIGATVETRLAAELARLVADEITLDDLTPALQGFLLHGHRLALASLLPEFTKLELAASQAEADSARLYSALFNPREPIKVGTSRVELEKRRHEYAGVTA